MSKPLWPHDPEALEQDWQAARVLLCCHGVPGMRFSNYRCYVLELYAAQRRYMGEQLAIECVIKVAKYVAQGLDQRILEEIRDTVFGVHAPTP